jgi:hypothetical protein
MHEFEGSFATIAASCEGGARMLADDAGLIWGLINFVHPFLRIDMEIDYC